jgi:hypothetical protein
MNFSMKIINNIKKSYKITVIILLFSVNAIFSTTSNIVENKITSENIATIQDLSEKPKALSINNEFIKVIVNNMADGNFAAMGRFAIETIMGDPQNKEDDNQSLIYGRPYPWTSFTTINIDGASYVFGGSGKKIQKRTGNKVQFGKIISQEKTEENLITKCSFDKNIEVIQTLTLFRNPSTRVKDTILISYKVINNDQKKHKVGIRIMLDTKLGSNDGAPFRIGTRSITSEEKFYGKALFDYWQTFDHLASPNVIAQGSIKVPEEGIYPPDKMYLVNWGTLADFVWDFKYTPGRSFIRAGEIEKDTSLALYWNPIEIAPKKERTVKTLYGLGGVSLAAGELSLGLTAPAEIYSASKKEILVMGYILNSGGFDSKNTIATFRLPSAFKLITGKLRYDIGLLKAGEVRQFPIKIALKKRKPGKQKLGITITSDTLEPNEIYRDIEILSAPAVHAVLRVPKKQYVKYNHFVDVTLELKNKTKHVIDKLFASLDTSNNLSLPKFEIHKKEINNLKPGAKVALNWKVKIKNPKIKKNKFIATVSSSLSEPKKYIAMINLKRPRQILKFKPSKKRIKKDDYFFIDCILENLRPYKNLDLIITYNNHMLEYNRISIPPWIKKTKQEGKITQEPNRIIISNLNNKSEDYLQDICKIHFKAKKEGSTELLIKKNNKVLKVINLKIK